MPRKPDLYGKVHAMMFYDRLKSLQPSHILTDYAYAAYLGIPREQLTRWKHGKCAPSIPMARRLAKKLKSDPVWLLFGD
jgi:transcriptional regulator with XRE-family HTH domain